MARLLSQITTIIRGSVGGITFSANQFHNIIARSKVAPVQPHTNAQTCMRSCFCACQNLWDHVLTDDQRRAWELYAPSCIYSGPLGPYTVSGRSMFIAGRGLVEYINARAFAVIVPNDNAPWVDGFYELSAVTAKYTVTPGPPAVHNIEVSLENYGAYDVVVLANLSPRKKIQRERYKGPWDDAMTKAQLVPAETAGLISFTVPTAVEAVSYFTRIRGVVTHSNIGHAITCEFFNRVEWEPPPGP